MRANLVQSYSEHCLLSSVSEPAGVASPKLSRILKSQKLSYSASVPRNPARIKISNLVYSQNTTSFSRTRENNKTNGNKIIRAGSEFAKREEKKQQVGVVAFRHEAAEYHAQTLLPIRMRVETTDWFQK
ncbi:hypothetical protein AVEN_26343-1 [Araneus ventricosus]|uniref:Uncharacterized protein n=1 Tax=Araneus ventricosus TaxID=182803 RepID=A0A4Y2ANT7_ARAVE|nr:hypothetical protein AVEN_26343-1 [Araneus ventricosus]